MSNPPGPSAYTAEQFAADVIAFLPLALPELQKLGFMKTCAHCGNTFNAGALVVDVGGEQGESMVANILALCNADREALTKCSPNDWAHVCETSGLFPAAREWPQLIQLLRYFAMVALRNVHGSVIATEIGSPPATPDLMKQEEP